MDGAIAADLSCRRLTYVRQEGEIVVIGDGHRSKAGRATCSYELSAKLRRILIANALRRPVAIPRRMDL
jgi:hypothetical protein